MRGRRANRGRARAVAVQIGEGARPRAPRGRATTQGVFSSVMTTRHRLR